MTENMVQCKLLMEQDGHRVFLITWVPQNLAKVGKRVKLEDTGDIFTISKTYTMMNKKEVIENSQDFRRTRKFSDV